jgi:hypothetical protein
MSAYYPIFMGPPPHTAVASATVTGRQVLEVSATGTVGPAAAASVKVVGVAGFDAAANAEVLVFRGGVQELTTVRTLAAGRAIGVALTTATTGNLVQVAFTA